MQQREPRFRTILPAQIRWNGPWRDASVQNVSSHGIMLRSAPVPQPGTYVELMVGSLSITARTVWAHADICGLRARTPIDFERLRERRSSDAHKASMAEFVGQNRRKSPPDFRRQAENSRNLGNAFQYLTALCVAVAVAGGLSWEVYKILSAPLSTVAIAMTRNQ
jgi:PilZ domain